MNINSSKNSWFLLPTYAGEKTGSILAWAQAELINDSVLMERVFTHFQNEVRNASLSLSFDDRATSTPALRCHAPFGSAFFLNLNLIELLGEIDQTRDGKSAILNWTDEATRRGLFNHWAPWLPSDASIAIEISNPDALEINDSLTPLGSLPIGSKNEPISVLIDGSWLGVQETGSQRAAIEVVRELQKNKNIKSISVFNLPSGFPDYAADLGELPKVKEVELENARYSDILWRPYQPSGEVNFRELNRYAKRIVMTYLDLIAYSNNSYHESENSWLSYRSSLRLAAIRCDGIIAISNDVKNQLIENMPGIDSSRIYAIPLGTDHLATGQNLIESARKISGSNIVSQNYVLCLGTNFAHKNRDFAISVMEEVRRRGLSLDLVFAGLLLDSTNSGERQTQKYQSDFPSWIKTLGSVGHNDRDWLLANASASIYPTSAEGFGLVPFESAAMNVPLVATNFGPLSELLSGQNLVEGWSVDNYANAVIELVGKPEVRESSIRHTLKESERLTWAKCANEVVECFLEIASREKSPANIASNEFESLFNTAQERFHEQVNAITSSLSWKFTAPIRALHKKVMGR
jgi:glycosyltransferase involved in cell wall biosynthesis